MFALKDYLLVEWANVDRTLRETLRFRYAESTAEYYNECAARLASIEKYIKRSKDDDGMRSLMVQLSNLSDLITRIERSHLEEFSWPFAFALRRIASEVCQEPAIGNLKPLFFFMAEGGAISYKVRPEPDERGVVGQRLLSVIFPRTLKEYVLLHTILGHEIGHAALSARPSELLPIMDKLVSNSIIGDPAKLYEWCLANDIGVTKRVDDDFLQYQAERWREELFCDLFAVVCMGPSFIPAFRFLLELWSKGDFGPYVPSHPPYGTRVIALLHYARALNLLYSEQTSGSAKSLAASLDRALIEDAARWEGGPFDMLDHSALSTAAAELSQFALKFDKLAFKPQKGRSLSELVAALKAKIPPVGHFPPRLDAAKSNILGPEELDFRHVLHAGWLRWSQLKTGDDKGEQFANINHFCALAILQQEGIMHWNDDTRTPKRVKP